MNEVRSEGRREGMLQVKETVGGLSLLLGEEVREAGDQSPPGAPDPGICRTSRAIDS